MRRTDIRHGRQGGAVSLIVVMLIIFIVSAGVASLLYMSSSSTHDAADNDDQLAAFFVAQSGIERAFAKLATSAAFGSDCTALAGTTTYDYGRGKFSYPTTTLESATSCRLTVLGQVNNAKRLLSIRVSNSTQQGAAGRGSKALLSLNGVNTYVAVLSHVAYISPESSTSSTFAQIGSVTMKDSFGNPVTSPDWTYVNNWDLSQHAYDANANPLVSSASILGQLGKLNTSKTGTDFSMTTNFVDGSGNALERSYADFAVILYTNTGTNCTSGNEGDCIHLKGTYAAANASAPTTTGNAGVGKTIPAGWNCAASSGTQALSAAAGSDSLFYAFAARNQVVGGNKLNAVTLGSQPLVNLASIYNGVGDPVYSQVWYTQNAKYLSSDTATVASGDLFTATIGASFSAQTVTSSDSVCSGGGYTKCLAVLNDNKSASSPNVPTGVLSSGDTIYNGTTSLGSLQSGKLGTTTIKVSGKNYNYDVYGANSLSNVNNDTALTSKSSFLSVTSTNSAAALMANLDAVYTSGGTFVGNLPPPSVTTINGLTATTYRLYQTDNATPITQTYVASAANNFTFTAVVKLSGSGVALPPAGMAFGVLTSAGAIGSWQFPVTSFTGSVSGTTLTVTSVSSGKLNVGDVIFGAGSNSVYANGLVGGAVKFNTHITALGSGTVGGAGTYTLNNNHAVAVPSGAMIARAGSAASSTSLKAFKLSQPPTNAITSSNWLCGGLCALLVDGAGSNIPFTLSNVPSGDSWASGFECLDNVSSTNMPTPMYSNSLLRGTWAELIN